MVPTKVYRLIEDNPRDIEDNTPEDGPIPIPSTLDMGKLENWVHYTPNILNANRLTHMEPEGDGDVDPEELKKRLEAADPYEPRLKPISLDKKVKGGLPAWVVRLCGDTTTFANANPALGKQNYGVSVARSMWWPGAYSFFTQGRWM